MDTEAQLQEFLRLKSFQEYALHIGLVLRYEITESFSTYAVGSVGPMVSNLGTERLRKGFAFSNVLGFGLSYRQNRLLFDVRLSFRHNSNANLYLPNNGHNSVGIESGMSYQLK
ncbi:acyloxyacyl hydrolase [Psychroflexus sp. CAK1W]|uniref:acyloxyacyl hydrolase n=1 Tax=Psychroflexus curvus TaxID=2873595 RepID=UPI001CCD2085|nr:acyloxyacyl hydrolase [Psychroflexus curvus]MBZ9626631.1 acyloxyacyl hydrolase [Psychroflexus curvus]